MKTYLVLFFSSDGASIRDVVAKPQGLGFKIVVGAHDLVYEWSNEPSEQDILDLGDKVKDALKGCNVMFKLETV